MALVPAVFPSLTLHAAGYEQLILKDQPAAYWRLNDAESSVAKNHAPGPDAARLDGIIEGKVALRQPGPNSDNFPEFEPDSTAAAFAGRDGLIRVKDPGADSALDFARGDSITLEAWVFLNRISPGQQVYIVGKGRTGNDGAAPNNQNYSLRLRGQDGQACVSFLFRNARNRPPGHAESDKDWHRWTSAEGFLPNSGWHHVAVTYTFGKGASLRGTIDGEEVKGAWDMGGRTDDGPVVDDDELWIGSSMGGNPGSTFNGIINEVALHRRALKEDVLRARYRHVPSGPKVDLVDLPKDSVRVEIFEDLGGLMSWNFTPGMPVESFLEPAFGFAYLPCKYTERGVRADRSNPFLVRASAAVTLPPGEHQILLRSLQAARLFRDGQLVAATDFIRGSGDGHGPVADPPEDPPAGLRFARMGHKEQAVTVRSEPGAGPNVFVLEAIVGGKSLRPDVGELSVSIRSTPAGGVEASRNTAEKGTATASEGTSSESDLFHLLAPSARVPHTDAGWLAHVDSQEHRVNAMNRETRRMRARDEERYWTERHQRARDHIATLPAITVPSVPESIPVHNAIDRFIGAKLVSTSIQPASLTDDWAFLRRITLDTLGLVPTPDQIRSYFADPPETRRARVIDRLLNHPAWADHWVAYWQDVLAENPGILKPTLNNTGPFRWWIRESFEEDKPLDRFATELIRMEGSVYGGGPAGFSLATQNDAPMADRAQIISQAFLGMNLACARCHDAPYHDFKQKDLFSLAAMLKKEPQPVPESSSIPADANIKVGRLVNVTLHPGDKVAPNWPFTGIMNGTTAGAASGSESDTRERLAATITDPRNERFARVMANRLWKRYLGTGLVEPADDWEGVHPSHPELLDWLARELVSNGYDSRHLARLILNSHTYQREAGVHTPESDSADDRVFASPARRRMSAEQLVDSSFAAAGKSLNAELLTLDNDGRRPPKDFLNLGYPERAWEFTSLSNDRDRPALSMPRTQEIVDVLGAFGWREARQNPITARDNAPNVLQSSVLANGGLGGGRVTRLSDGSAITALCLEDQPLSSLIDAMFQRVLTRPPTPEERAMFENYLGPGYETRARPAPPKSVAQPYDETLLLSWSNHLNPRATEIKMAAEEKAARGDAPTHRLEPDWRERAEDMLWTLINTPEFVFVP